MEKVVFTCMESEKLVEVLQNLRGVIGVSEDINVVELYFDELKVSVGVLYVEILNGLRKYSDGKGTVYFSRVSHFRELKKIKSEDNFSDVNIMCSVV